MTPRSLNKYDTEAQVASLNVHATTRLLAGVHPRIVADEAGVSLRTAYRWRQGLRAVELVTVDGWSASFARFVYRPPLRISAWERAA